VAFRNGEKLFESDAQKERPSPDIPDTPGARIKKPVRIAAKIPVDRYACFHRRMTLQEK
jgi:hypothetical protein